MLILLALAPSTLTGAIGCQVLQPSVPLNVTVRDAETKLPVPGAEVTFLYPTNGTDKDQQSHLINVRTNQTGVAQIQAATQEDALPQLRISAANYLSEERGLPGDALRALKSAGPLSALSGKQEPVEVALEIYRGPTPVIELSVPKNYRGLVKVDVRINEYVAYEPGQRVFRVHVPADGLAQLDGPAILRHDRGPIFVARYPDETLVPKDVKDEEVGFRWLRAEGRTEVFVIGTKAEWENFRRAGARSTRSDSGGSGGGGRRGG